MRRTRISHLSIGLLLGYLLIAVALVYWTVGRGTALAERPDNPRRVEDELRIRRGQILDRNNAVLAETMGPVDDPERVYPVPNIGPAVGYYTFRYGTSGVEEGYDAVLRGDSDDVWEAFWRENLHAAQTGRDIRLTLNVTWQRAAEAVLGDSQGAVVLLALPDATIGALSSHPGYDPNRLDEDFEALVADEQAPLLNRASQGQYQPGLALQPFVLAAAAGQNLLALEETVADANRPVQVHGLERQCATAPPQEATWVDVLQNNCPYPMQTLARSLSEAELAAIFAGFGLTEQPQVPLTVASPPAEPVVDLEAALVGQDALTVTPLQMARAWAALANGGMLPPLQLVSAVQDGSGVWQAVTPEPEPVAAVPAPAAEAVLAALPRPEGYREYATLALAGPEGNRNGWYLGLAPAGEPRYAVVVVLENSENLFEAQRVGRALLRVVSGG